MEIISYIGIVLLVVLFGLSIWGNVFLLRKLMHVSENLHNVLSTLKDYSSHLKEVYNMERFYGDQTLHGLLEHSQEIGEDLENFIEQYEQTQKEPPSQE
tara:strand:+ start:449 stop:745 length:297 start_codon:yes stop_codon:yes gene_type:complete